MKIPVLYGQKGRSFRLANYPWQSMNVKRIIRDRVYRATLFSPRNYPFTLSTREKKEKKKMNAHSTSIRSCLLSFLETIHLVLCIFFSKLKEISMQMRHNYDEIKMARNLPPTMEIILRRIREKSFRFEETTVSI